MRVFLGIDGVECGLGVLGDQDVTRSFVPRHADKDIHHLDKTIRMTTSLQDPWPWSTSSLGRSHGYAVSACVHERMRCVACADGRSPDLMISRGNGRPLCLPAVAAIR